MKLNIITPCSRPENLQRLYNSINFPCIWYIVFDLDKKEYATKIFDNPDYSFLQNEWIKIFAEKGGVSGNLQRNKALDAIEKGFVYFLDDDNLMHPNFYKTTINILNENPDKRCIFYSQQLAQNKIRSVDSTTIKAGRIDQAQFLIHTDLIGKKRYIQKYEADGLFIQEIFKQNLKSVFFYFNEKPIVYYNKLWKK